MLSVLGLAFLLFLASMEGVLEQWRERFLVLVGPALLLLLGLALLVGFGLYLAGQVVSPVLIAIILVATARGSVVPLLEDGDENAAAFGQLIITGAMFVEFDSIILLWLFFLRLEEGESNTARLGVGGEEGELRRGVRAFGVLP